jgi:quinol monooxygenase YgiN
VAIKVIVELQAKPGKRAELKSLLESVVATLGPGEPGFLGSTRYEVLDNPDILVEIADWASAEVRAAAMQQAMDSGAYSPLGELLAAPFRATVIRQLPCRAAGVTSKSGSAKVRFALPRPEWPTSVQLRKSYQKERGATWLLPAVYPSPPAIHSFVPLRSAESLSV